MNQVTVTRTTADGEKITDQWPQFVWNNLPFNEDGSKGDVGMGWRLDQPAEVKTLPKTSK